MQWFCVNGPVVRVSFRSGLVTSVQFSAIFSPSLAASACEIGGLSLSVSVFPVVSAQRLSTLQLEEHKTVVFVRVLAWSGR